MVEAGAEEVPEETILQALELAHTEIIKLCEAQEDLRRQVGKPKWLEPELTAELKEQHGARVREAISKHGLREAAFVEADFPPDTTGVMVTGPLMPWETRQRLHRAAQRRTRFELLEFVPDPVPLIERADRVIAMGGYNTVCEVLSFEKPALIVPRVTEPEQGIRARRMQELGLLDVLHPDDLSPQALAEWLARDPGPRPATGGRVDLGGLIRIPGLLAELLGVPAGPLQPAAPAAPAGAEVGLT